MASPLVPPNCRECRLGSLTVPCKPDDVRRLVLVTGNPARVDDDAPPVKRYRTQVVQGLGPIPCPVMLLGEAPGFHEDRNGVGFWPDAPAGRVLAECMRLAGLKRWYDDIDPMAAWGAPWAYIDNVVHCRPLDNKIDKFPDAVEACRSLYLEETIKQVQPKVIVAMGVTASVYWFGKVRNASRTLPDGTVVIATAHPSSIARGNVDAKQRLIAALKRAREIGYGPSI